VSIALKWTLHAPLNSSIRGWNRKHPASPVKPPALRALSTTSDPLYEHRCTLPDRTLWFGRASLYEDRICIRGWTWQGRYSREVAVEDIEKVDWRPKPTGPNMFLHLEGGRTVRFRLRKGSGLWNAKLHNLIGESLLNRHSLPSDGRGTDESSEETSS